MKKKQLLLFFSVLFLSLTAHAGSGIFLRGGDIDAGWEPLPEWEFIDEGDGVYTLTDKVLSGEFKVADATWNTINYGLNDDASIVPGVAVTMAYNGGNMKCVEPYTCSKITFTLKDDVATLLLEVAGYESSGIFLRGEITNWEPLANWQFIKEDEGVYALYDKKLAGRFKIGGNDWNTNNYGFNYYDPGSTFDINTPCVLISDGGDIMIDKIYNCTKITLTLQNDGEALLLVEGSVMYNSGLFLVGDVTSWTIDPDWEFVDSGDGKYILKDKVLYGDFRINQFVLNECYYGGNGSKISLSEEYTLGAIGNIVCNDDFDCTQITLNKYAANGVSLLLEGTVKTRENPAQVYIMGNNNNWDFNDESGKLSPTTKENEYAGTVSFVGASTSDNICYWRIYEGLGMYGSWGNVGGNNTSGHTTSGVLEHGSQGCITTNPGDYKVTFNIKTGEFTAVPADGTGVDAALSGDDLSITIDKGILTLTQSASRITVYMANGSHILTAVDTHIVNLSALSKGIYILKIETPDETKSYKISL